MARIFAATVAIQLGLCTCAFSQATADWAGAGEFERLSGSEVISQTAIEPFRSDPARVFNSAAELPIRRYKQQALQEVTVSAGGIAATNGGDLSSSHFEAAIGLGIPLGLIRGLRSGARESRDGMKSAIADRPPDILGITPEFRADFINAARGIDAPTELYDVGVSVFYRKTINDRLSTLAIIKPSVRSDFTTSDNALRFFGLGLVTWDYLSDELSLSVGAVYLDRADVPLLPALGLTWTPRPSTRVELQFPQSRVAWRLASDGGSSETWSYLSAGIGGNTWAISHSDGTSDEFSLGDVRLILGLDHIVDGGGGWFAEFGYSFNRHLEYESSQTRIDLSDGIVLQAGWRY